MKVIYEQKGHPHDWIKKRSRGISEYAILRNEIMESTFGLKVEDYKKIKGLDKENLRNHLDDMEIILFILSEEGN